MTLLTGGKVCCVSCHCILVEPKQQCSVIIKECLAAVYTMTLLTGGKVCCVYIYHVLLKWVIDVGAIYQKLFHLLPVTRSRKS